MDVTLANVEWKFILAYLDRMVTFSKTLKRHIDFVKHVLTLLQRAEATVKLKKRFICTDKIDYLGQLIWPRRLEIAAHTTNQIQ